MTSLPTTTASVTAEWLTNALRSGGTIDAQTTVATVEAKNMGAGIGFMGEVGRLEVTYAGGPGPKDIICKIPTQDPMIRGMLGPARVFEREARFYSEVAPQLSVVPQAYAVMAEYETDDYVLLMQDLGHLREGDQSVGVNAKDAMNALKTVARLHAEFWESPRLNSYEWVPAINSEGMKIGAGIYDQSLPGFLQVFAHAIDADMVPLMEKFGSNVHQLLDRFAAMPNTIVHFDYRLDNLFFGEGDDVWVIDFQTSSRGGGAYDVGYFMSQSVPIDVRREHEAALLKGYHDELIANGVTGYAFDQFMEDYRVGVLYGWIIPVYAVGTLDSSSERAMALWTEVIKRAQAAMRDHHVADLMN
jgi:hypothetical protein